MLNLLGAVFFGLGAILSVVLLLGGPSFIEVVALLVASFACGAASRQCLVDYKARRRQPGTPNP